MENEKLNKKECEELLMRAREYACGTGAPKDTEKAAQLLTEAVEGYLKPEVAEMVEEAFKNDLSELAELLTVAVKADNAFALYLIWQNGLLREICDMGDMNHYDLVDKSAACGNAEMKYVCGMEYVHWLQCGSKWQKRTGLNEADVKAKAAGFIDEAVQMGLADAQYAYYLLTVNFHIEDEDPLKGIKCCEAAAKNGHVYAQYDLGRLLIDNPDEEISKEGLFWIMRAARGGLADAMFTVAKRHSEETHYFLAMEWYQKAAEKGDARAQWILCCEGDSSYDMYDVANELYLYADKGDDDARMMLEMMIEQPEKFKKFGVYMSRNEYGFSINRCRDKSSEEYAGEIPLCAENDDDEALGKENDECGAFGARKMPSAFDTNYQVVMLFKRKVIFTDLRIDHDSVPEGYYCYDIREDDGFSYKPCQVGNYVMVNHMGTVISDEPIELDENGFRSINLRKKEWKATDEWTTLEQYMEECPPTDFKEE